MRHANRPFQTLRAATHRPSPLRDAITRATRLDEATCVQALLSEATLAPDQSAAAQAQALSLATRLRQGQASPGRTGLVQALMQEFSLSSHEGIALMCMAEALLRIPDEATRDALIRDKIAHANWAAHLGHSPSLFVNAATWGLVLTGKLVGTHAETGLRAALQQVAIKGGEPLIRKAVDVAMRMLGQQFVMGETIQQALGHAPAREAQGFRHSYDMLGEAALTDADAQRYLQAYEDAIRAIGASVNGRSLYEAPGISIKLSALHPRYSRAQYTRVMDELYPRLLMLTRLARHHHIGLNIDAEESERLELSLDLLERLCLEPELQGWDGIGFVVQAYQKRCPFVLDYLIDLARRSGHRLMVRLVKGAYWDSEIKRAQVDGLADYPVYTRKPHTDAAYLACARKLLAAPAEVYPQFATHNAHTLAAICQLAAPLYQPGQYEFQCLHGMGEALYEMVVGPEAVGGLGRPCRIYAPVGTHETLLAYLVRRLLENGANTSFVNRVADEAVSLAELVADPVAHILDTARREGTVGAPNPAIVKPPALFMPDRLNSPGLDLHNPHTLDLLHADLAPLAALPLAPAPLHAATPAEVAHAVQTSAAHAAAWRHTPVAQRAQMLDRAADLMQARMPLLINLLVREAGKTLGNAVGEVREAIDFLRFNAAQARSDLVDGHHQPLGPIACISPWNFPLAIFTGQVAAALAAGNTVLAKPAEQTPLVAAQAVALLHEAGVPREALQLLPGAGDVVGAALVAQTAIRGVMFTGSTDVARLLQKQLAGRLSEDGRPLVLIAETGGQNAMIVDSSALPEQVVNDVLSSAFDSAGQRCSALRVLCLQADIAERVLTMLRGAMNEWQLGPADRLDTDVGPLIDEAALQAVQRHVAAMAARGHAVYQAPLAVDAVAAQATGCFMAPTLIELPSLAELTHEVFGPVLHVLRFERHELGALLDQVHATGYGLTLGVHSRIDETIDFITQRARVGNIYVNRNMVGAVVGVQPFGGEGLSGTGPKAGGPLYLHRLLRPSADTVASAGSLQRMAAQRPAGALPGLLGLVDWLKAAPLAEAPPLLACAQWLLQTSPAGFDTVLVGPTGERNSYALRARERVLCLGAQAGDLVHELATVLAAGSVAVWPEGAVARGLYGLLPEAVQACVQWVPDWGSAAWDAVLLHGNAEAVASVGRLLADRAGPIVGLLAAPVGCHVAGVFSVFALMTERTVSVNTAAAGGNAGLLVLG